MSEEAQAAIKQEYRQVGEQAEKAKQALEAAEKQQHKQHQEERQQLDAEQTQELDETRKEEPGKVQEVEQRHQQQRNELEQRQQEESDKLAQGYEKLAQEIDGARRDVREARQEAKDEGKDTDHEAVEKLQQRKEALETLEQDYEQGQEHTQDRQKRQDQTKDRDEAQSRDANWDKEQERDEAQLTQRWEEMSQEAEAAIKQEYRQAGEQAEKTRQALEAAEKQQHKQHHEERQQLDAEQTQELDETRKEDPGKVQEVEQRHQQQRNELEQRRQEETDKLAQAYDELAQEMDGARRDVREARQEARDEGKDTDHEAVEKLQKRKEALERMERDCRDLDWSDMTRELQEAGQHDVDTDQKADAQLKEALAQQEIDADRLRQDAANDRTVDQYKGWERLPMTQREVLQKAWDRDASLLDRAVQSEHEAQHKKAIDELLSEVFENKLSNQDVERLEKAIHTLHGEHLAERGALDADAQTRVLGQLEDNDLRKTLEDNPWMQKINAQKLQKYWDDYSQGDDNKSVFSHYVAARRLAHARGALGELDAPHSLSDRYEVLKGLQGPDHEANVTNRGTDAIFIELPSVAAKEKPEILVTDNKAYSEKGIINSVPALVENLAENLRDDAKEVAAYLDYWKGRGEPAPPAYIREAADRLQNAAAEIGKITHGLGKEDLRRIETQQQIQAALDRHRIRREITTARGASTDASEYLKNVGIKIRHLH